MPDANMPHDSVEKLALSCTFVMADGKISEVDTVHSAASGALLPAGFVVDGKYRVVKLVGAGGMGSVYQVHHQLLKKDMALKTLSANLNNLQGASWQRFQREAQAIAKLRHKNIVEVFDFGIADGELPYYTMELLGGENLADKLTREGPCAPAAALDLFIQVAEGLAHAHRSQIVHRDIKPGNIYLTGSGGAVKIVDFGIAKLMTDKNEGDQFVTGAGLIFGSPLYMSPEQSLGQTVDTRSDIYSFGCTLFHALTGSPPFVGDTPFLTLMAHQTAESPTLKSRIATAIPQRLESVIARLLSKSPERRYQTLEEVITDLRLCKDAIASQTPTGAGELSEVIASEPPIGGRSNWLLLAAVAGIVLVITGIAAGFASYLSRPASTSSLPAPAPSSTDNLPHITPQQETLVVKKISSGHGLEPFETTFTTRGGRVFKTIDFAEGNKTAIFIVEGLPKPMPCVGKLTYPADCKVLLNCGPSTTADFIRRLHPDDIFGLHLEYHDRDFTLEEMEAVSRLTGLRRLNLSYQPVDDRWISCIDKLPNLDELIVTNTPATGAQYARLRRLSLFGRLSISSVSGAMDIVRALKKPYHINMLHLDSDRITDADLLEIARLNTLVEIYLDFNNVSARGLEALTTLPRLERLTLAKIDLDSRVIAPLAKMRKLKFVKLSAKDWPNADLVKLHSVLPTGCEIAVSDSRYFKE